MKSSSSNIGYRRLDGDGQGNYVSADDNPDDSYVENIIVEGRRKCSFSYVRYLMAILSFLGYANVYGMRVNLSMAIVKMVEKSNITLSNGTIQVHQSFNWSSEQQGMILSSFFWGYIVTQIPGGILAGKIGGQKVFGYGILSTSILTVLTPLITHYGGLQCLIALRIAEGLGEGVTFPSQQSFWSRWAPQQELTRLTIISVCGCYFGTVISLPLCGFLADYYGWESIFYVYGTIGILWCIFWFLLSSNGPESHRFISNTETDLILNNRGSDVVAFGVKNVPWGKILSSAPVYAIFVAHFCENWGWYTMLTELPTYMNDILKFNLKESGVLASLPYLALTVIAMSCAQLSDYLCTRQYLSTMCVRKVFNTIGFMSQMTFLLLTAYTNSPITAVVYLTFGIGLGGFAVSAFQVNPLDISPQYACILMGISNTAATIPGIISPTITGMITVNKTAAEWRIVFMISSAIYAFGAAIFALFASGSIQPWNYQEYS